jgi:hypothetical protein
VVAREFFECERQFGVLGFGERFGRGVGAFGVSRRGKHVAKLLPAQWFLRGEQQRFENRFQFHF